MSSISKPSSDAGARWLRMIPHTVRVWGICNFYARYHNERGVINGRARMNACQDFYTTLFERSIPSLWGRIVVQHHTLDYAGGKYDFLRIASADINESDRVIIIRAGVHGEEISGPRTLARYLKEIFDFADRRGLKLVIYILGNPSGF